MKAKMHFVKISLCLLPLCMATDAFSQDPMQGKEYAGLIQMNLPKEGMWAGFYPLSPARQYEHPFKLSFNGEPWWYIYLQDNKGELVTVKGPMDYTVDPKSNLLTLELKSFGLGRKAPYSEVNLMLTPIFTTGRMTVVGYDREGKTQKEYEDKLTEMFTAGEGVLLRHGDFRGMEKFEVQLTEKGPLSRYELFTEKLPAWMKSMLYKKIFLTP